MGLFSSNKSSTVNNQTDNYFFDQRQVNDASGGGVIGSGNYLDGSQNWYQSTDWTQQTRDSNNQTWTQQTTDSNNQYWDGSNRSTNNWDASNRSTNNWSQDNSNRSTNNWSDNSSVTITDGGAVQAMYGLGAAQSETARAIGLSGIDAAQQAAGWASSAAIKSQENAIASNDRTLAAALGFAKSAADTVAKSSSDALGWAGQQFGAIAGITASVLQANGAATASATQAAQTAAAGSEKWGKYALAAAGVLALMFISRKG